MEKRVADIIVETLLENNITQAYSVVGGGAMHLNNAFALVQDKCKTIYNHHEQACAMAAEGYAKISGNLAAVCVTSGPGGLNTLNGVQGAYVDSIPMIIISGHPRYDTTVEACGLDIRCRGVQENDIISQVKNITKYAKLVKNPLSVKAEVNYAIHIAMSGRRGPVWLSFPLDVQGTFVDTESLYDNYEILPRTNQNGHIEQMYSLLKKAKRPCILTGSGIRSGNAYKEYRQFIEYTKIPIVGGYTAMDANNIEDIGFYGKSGSIGPRCGNFILQNSDFILALGNSLSTTQTGFNVDAFAPNARIVMVDIQPDEAKKPGLSVDLCIQTELIDFFNYCNVKKEPVEADKEWWEYCNSLYEQLPQDEVLHISEIHADNNRVHPTLFWKRLSLKMEEDAMVALGNSSCNQGAIQLGKYKEDQRIIVNVNNGSMGDDLPEAIGAATAKNAPVYCITGDGSIMMNIQELQTIKHHNLPIKIILFSNNGYDNIRNTCVNYFDGLRNGCDSDSGISFPKFELIANAFAIKYHHLEKVQDIDLAIEWLVEQDGPCFLEVDEIPCKARIPVIKSIMDDHGKFVTPPLHVMSPLLDDDTINKLML